jgi:hypothetical protein
MFVCATFWYYVVFSKRFDFKSKHNLFWAVYKTFLFLRNRHFNHCFFFFPLSCNPIIDIFEVSFLDYACFFNTGGGLLLSYHTLSYFVRLHFIPLHFFPIAFFLLHFLYCTFSYHTMSQALNVILPIYFIISFCPTAFCPTAFCPTAFCPTACCPATLCPTR